MRKALILLLVTVCFGCYVSYAQKAAVKTNLLYDATSTLNLGVEFGLGFGFAGLTGSRANDAFRMQGTRVVTATNHNGGVNGGISNGMPLVLRTVVKPTPSIYKVQQTVDFAAKRNATLQISGRHDPCILHRARVVQDSLVAFGLADLCGQHFGTAWQEGAAWNMD